MDTLSVPVRKQTPSRYSAHFHWRQLWSLAALYASITVGWIAYQNYQPQLLVRFQFTDFTLTLAIAQAVILVATPLVAGRIGDRYRVKRGHRLPIIAAGVSIAAMVFMAVAFTLLAEPGELLRWALPVLIILWLASMSLFTSPALSTLELFAPLEELPYAAAVLTITGNVVYSLEPVIVDVINFAGAPVTFVAGGLAVSLSGYALKRNSLALFRRNGDREAGLPRGIRGSSPYGLIFFLGIASGLVVVILFYGVPHVFAAAAGREGDEARMFVSATLLVSAALSWPFSNLVNRYGVGRSFLVAVLLVPLSILMAVVGSPVALLLGALLFVVAMTVISVAALPIVIGQAAPAEKVFAVGIFFSAAALPEGLWEAWLASGQ